jgi:four helix bundle protein
MKEAKVAKGDDIEERLVNFAVRIVKLSGHLPATQAGKHIGGQVLRSGTAPAAHYAEARGAESRKDFVHKLKICLKELDETRVWLKMVTRSEMVPTARLSEITNECDELCRIINASIKTTLTRKR